MNGGRFVVPRSAVQILAVLVAVHLVRTLLPYEYEIYLIYFLAFDLFRTGSFGPEWLYGAVTSIFVHADWLHLIANGLWIVALSSRIGSTMSGRRFWFLFVASGTCGALTHAALNWGESQLLVGASGGVFGLLGAGAHIRVHGHIHAGRPTLREYVSYILLMMLIVNIAYALISNANISWEAHAGGFFAGLILFPFLCPRHPPPGFHVRTL